MRTYLDRICVALSVAAVFSIATTNLSSAGPFTNGTIPAARVPAAVYPVRVAPPAQRVIVVYKPVPVMIRQGGGNASAAGNGGAGAASGKSSSSSGGGSGGGSSGGGSVGDVFKQALGDFAKSAIDGLLKLPSK
jgi:uncharacterized membrane protein YgcG